MFQWYRDAEVCYAFLSDVDADENPHSEASSFRKARWFTRGWTLQELIAPGVVYFYGAGWKEIGSRETLLDLIVDLTHISASCFATGDLAQFSVAQKMSWAAERETTRVEDKTYSLLGLFDINMPLLYGEGERAFQRLQEEILRQYEDDSLFAHCGSDILAKSPWSFKNCADITHLDDWPYYQNLSNPLNRNLSLNYARITMTFPTTQYTGFGEPPGSLLLAMLNCGTAEAPVALVLRKDKDKPGIWSKTYHLTGEKAQAALWSRCVKNRTVSVARAKRGSDRVWEWWPAYAKWNTVISRLQDADRVREEPTMTQLVRPLPELVTVQDVLRDNIIVKGPGETSGFEVQYVYAVRFQARWLGQSDEVHLIPIYGEDQGQSCVVFSRAGGRSFMVTLRPTRASVNANLYTDIPPWKGENTLAYMEGLERDRRENKGEDPCCRATQRVDSGENVVVELQSRRRSNGWWVHVSVAQPPVVFRRNLEDVSRGSRSSRARSGRRKRHGRRHRG